MTIEKRYIWTFTSPTAPKPGRVVTPPTSQVTTWSTKKLKTLYPHLHKTYGLQTWQGGDLEWGTWSLHF